jgi:hypothetical protein
MHIGIGRFRLAAGLALGLCASAMAALDWPADRVFPRFASFSALDVADLTGMPFERKAALISLQGLVNREAPRIYMLDGNQSGEGKSFWLDHIPAAKNSIADPLSLFTKYAGAAKGLCIYDPAVPGTIDVAVTCAGVLDGVVASPTMAQVLGGAPYRLPTLVDLRNRGFADDRAAMAWGIKEYWPRCTHRMLAGLKPGVNHPLIDYVVANRALCLWLAPDSAQDKPLLDSVFKDMPVNGVYIGWWAGETSGVGYASRHGVHTYASDWFANATVHGGDLRGPASLPSPKPPVANGAKVQVALIYSDGDNLQEQEHMFPKRWKDPLRGSFPVSWTQSPALVDFAPALLAYYYETRTANDAFVTGPSGVGYVLPGQMERADFQAFAGMTETYLKRSGIQSLTVWGNSSAASDWYGSYCPGVLGFANHQAGGAPAGQRWWTGGMPSVYMDPDYASLGSQIIDRIRIHMGEWDRKGPLFLAAQLNANVANLDQFKVVVDYFADSANVVFVTADQLFQAMRKAAPTGIAILSPGPGGRLGLHQPIQAAFPWQGGRDDLLGRRAPGPLLSP